jgi:hypothetical protein
MRKSEYEKRRRALEKQYEEDLELLRTAHHARLRALEALFASSTEHQGEPIPSVASTSASPVESRERQALPQGWLEQAVLDALPQLPEVFVRHDVEKALGFTPPRSSLVRILRDMWRDGELKIEEISEGRLQTKYRKVAGPG